MPPVSAFEAPRLKMAGKTQSLAAIIGFSVVVKIDKNTREDTSLM